MSLAASVGVGSGTKSLRDRALLAGVVLNRDVFRDLRCWVCAVGRGDFASIDRGFFHEHAPFHTDDTPACAYDRGHERAHPWTSISNQPSARLQAFCGLAGTVSGLSDAG